MATKPKAAESPKDDATHPDQPSTTKGATFQEAAEAATPAEEAPSKGYTLAEVIAGPAPDDRPGLKDDGTPEDETVPEDQPEPAPKPDADKDS